MPILSLKNISKTFSSTKVLNNIDLELDKGEFFSVVGPSGCGKTTLLKTIADELPPEKKYRDSFSELRFVSEYDSF